MLTAVFMHEALGLMTWLTPGRRAVPGSAAVPGEKTALVANQKKAGSAA